MNIEYLPVINIDDLQEAIELQYGEDTFKEYELRSLLFDDYYSNDSFKRYSWEDAPYEYRKEYSWTTEEKVRLENFVAGYLADIIPNQKEALIDVSW